MWPSICRSLKTSLNLLLPPCCLLCSKRLDDSRVPAFCPQCINAVPALSLAHCRCCKHPFPEATSNHLCKNCLLRPPNFSLVYTVGCYHGSIQQAIQRLKYRQQLILAKPLGEMLGTVVMTVSDFLPEYIVPVPLHPRRLRQRGYNQALEIARPISRMTGVPLNRALLQRTRHTTAQQGLSAEARRSNLRNAFKLTDQLLGAEVLLVDDVMTTGETARACSEALIKGGASQVRVAVVGRA